MVKKILVWSLGAFLIFFVTYRPSAAASIARSLGAMLGGMATGFGDFVSGIAR